ncbi:MAG: hypothetical protein EPN93_11100 [Spirochaetes bacterium]|nr:MAG: hypothetical protein EPN93_11100 [Spirochaetota bacterium]
MNRTETILKKLDNVTYLLELIRSEMEGMITESLLDAGTTYNKKLEIKELHEDTKKVLEGFHVSLDQDKGVLVEFQDGEEIPFSALDSDEMYDIFVRIHSSLLDDTIAYN